MVSLTTTYPLAEPDDRWLTDCRTRVIDHFASS